MILRADIIVETRTWLDVPWRHQGRSRDGVDCVGLPVMVGEALGVWDVPKEQYIRDYTMRPQPSEFLRLVKTHMKRIPMASARNGSVLIFREPRVPCHAGILEVDSAGQRWLYHAYAVTRKVIREAMSDEREERCMMAFDYHGVEA